MKMMIITKSLSQIIIISLMIFLTLAHYSVEDCKTIGFKKANLLCSTCEKLKRFELDVVHDKCRECCLEDDNVIDLKRYPKMVLEVCTCKFSAYPQIQAFIKSDRPGKYKNLRIKYVRGLDPVMKLYDANDKVEDELDITKWDTDDVDEFLQTHLILD